MDDILDFHKYLMKNAIYKMMFGFIKKMFIGLLSVSTIGSFRESLFSNLKRPINCVSQP